MGVLTMHNYFEEPYKVFPALIDGDNSIIHEEIWEDFPKISPYIFNN